MSTWRRFVAKLVCTVLRSTHWNQRRHGVLGEQSRNVDRLSTIVEKTGMNGIPHIGPHASGVTCTLFF